MVDRKFQAFDELCLSRSITEGIYLDLGCGARKRPGYVGIDTIDLEGVDIVCDLKDGLPVSDNTVDGIYSSFFLEHLPDTIGVFKEMYRICKNGAVVEFRVPYYQSVTQYKDPTHSAVLPPEMMRYFSDEMWYGSDYGIGTNFKLVRTEFHYLSPFHLLASPKLFFLWPLTYPVLLFARRFFWNVVHSVTISLRVEK